MKRTMVLITLAVFTSVSGLITADYVPGKLIVRLERGILEMDGVDEVPISQVTINDSGLETALQAYETQSVEKLFKSPSAQAGLTYNDVRDVYLFTMNETLDMEVVAEELEEESSVICAEPNYLTEDYTFPPPNDPDFEYDSAHPNDPYQWGLHNDYPGKPDWDINILDAWEYNTGHPDILLGFVDTGLEEEHYDSVGDEFYGRIAPNGFINGGEDDGNGHGTNMVGVAAATTGNGAGHEGHGIAGVAGGWNGQGGVSLLIAKKESNVASIIHCYDSLRERGANIINHSGGLGMLEPEDITSIWLAIENAFAEDISIFIAAGNIHGPVKFPASLAEYDICSAVGGIDTLGMKLYPLSFGPELSFAAPCESIFTTTTPRYGPYYKNVSGTSPATAFASGVGALLYSEAYENGDSLIDVDCKRIMQHSARFNPAYDTQLVTEIGPFNDTIGYGCIDAYEALRRLNDPYTHVHGLISNLTSTLIGSDSVEFTRPVQAEGPTYSTIFPAGTYQCSIYRLTGSVSFNPNYSEKPWVWGLLCKGDPGFKYENPNDGWFWVGVSDVTTTLASFETYVYFTVLIDTIATKPETSYVSVPYYIPRSPSNIEIVYTVNGRTETLPSPSGIEGKVSEPQLTIIGSNLGSSITVKYQIPQSSEARLEVYDVSGRRVAETRLIDAEGQVELDVSHLPAGCYFVHLKSSDISRVSKVILLD